MKAVKEHKGAKFKLDEEKDAQAAFNKYKRQSHLHGLIFTDQCFKTIKDLDEALKGRTDNRRL